jgi:hypothetical protein
LDAGAGGPAVDAGPLPHCSSVDPIGPVIADFDALNNQAFGQFGIDPVVGGTFVTPGTLFEDFTDANWHLVGSVTGPVSFGFTWQCPAVIDGVCTLNLLRYAGLQFTVSGNIGPAGILHVTAGSVPDEAPTGGFGCGRCNEQGATEACTAPFTNVTPGSVVSPGQTWSLTWNIFQSGSPIGTPDPYWVTAISWTLPAATDGGSYPVDFTLDDIRLIPIPH